MPQHTAATLEDLFLDLLDLHASNTHTAKVTKKLSVVSPRTLVEAMSETLRRPTPETKEQQDELRAEQRAILHLLDLKKVKYEVLISILTGAMHYPNIPQKNHLEEQTQELKAA